MRLKCHGILCFCFLILQLLSNIKAQPVNIQNLSFLNTSADTVVFYGQSKDKFKGFADKFSQMIRLGNRQINILHIGDSHLQADLYTGQTRKNFQSFMSGLEGSRGMVTPFLKGCPDSYKVSFSPQWHSINILSSSDKTHLGLWGTTAYTDSKESSLTVSVNSKNPIKYDFNRLRIYHSELFDGDNITLSGIETAYQKIYNQDKGYTEFILADYIAEVKITVSRQSSAAFWLYGFYFNNSAVGVVYNVTGTNGASAQSYLNADRLTEQLASLNIDMIIISLGTNDTYEPGGENSFGNNLTALVNKIKETKSNIPILLITPVECRYHKRMINPRQEKTVEIIKNTAQNTGCAYLDMYSVLGGKGSSDKLFSNSLMQPDRVHLTAKGYQLQGDLLYNALWNALEKNF